MASVFSCRMPSRFTPNQPTPAVIRPSRPNPIISLAWVPRFLNHFMSSTPYRRSVMSRTADLTDLIDVQDEQQAVGQFVGAADHLPRRRRERFRRLLEQLLRDLHNVADLIDQQANRAVFGMNNHVDVELIGGSVLEIESAAQVNGGEDLAAQVDQAAHYQGRKRHARHLLGADDLLDLE